MVVFEYPLQGPAVRTLDSGVATCQTRELNVLASDIRYLQLCELMDVFVASYYLCQHLLAVISTCQVYFTGCNFPVLPLEKNSTLPSMCAKHKYLTPFVGGGIVGSIFPHIELDRIESTLANSLPLQFALIGAAVNQASFTLS